MTPSSAADAPSAPAPAPAGYFCIAGAALCWGFSAAFAKLLFAADADPLTLAQLRATFSFLVLLLVAVIARRGMLHVPARLAWGLAVLGIVGIAASNYTYLSAIHHTNVTTAILLQYTGPVWVVLFAGLFLRERLTPLQIFATALSFGGCLLAVGGYRGGQLAWNGAGVAFGMGAALSFAFINLWGSHLTKRVELWPSLLYSLAAASIFWALVRSPIALLQTLSARQWSIFFLYAMLSILAPYALFYAGLRRLPATHVAITATLEPVFAILFAVLIAGERLVALQIAGMAAVIAAVLLLRRPGQEKAQ